MPTAQLDTSQKEDVHMVNRNTKNKTEAETPKMLSIPDHQGDANQNHMRHHFIPLRPAGIKKTKDNKHWQEYEETGTLHTGGNVHQYSCYGKQQCSDGKPVRPFNDNKRPAVAHVQ